MWCKLVQQNAKTDFYKGLSFIISGALQELMEQFDVKAFKEENQ
jgi:hypothetical protein